MNTVCVAFQYGMTLKESVDLHASDFEGIVDEYEKKFSKGQVIYRVEAQFFLVAYSLQSSWGIIIPK